MDDEKAPEGHEKHHPAGKLVEKAQGFVRIPVLDAQSRAEDAHSVGRNRDRNAGQGKHGAPREGLLQEVPIENRKREQAYQGVDTATGLRHFQFHGGELDDVALSQHGHTEQGQQIAGKL